MYGTNDLDVALHNPIRPDDPSGVRHTVTCHALLIKGERGLFSGDSESDDYIGRGAHIEKLINRSTDVLHEPGKCDRSPRIGLVSSWNLTLPIHISRPLQGRSRSMNEIFRHGTWGEPTYVDTDMCRRLSP